MKNVITAVASLILLLALILQFSQNQIVFMKITSLDQAVNSFRETVKQEGKISEANEEKLKKAYAEILSCKESDIKISGDRKSVFRGQYISYRVSAPVEGMIRSSRFWGIAETENILNYEVSGYTTSEYIGR